MEENKYKSRFVPESEIDLPNYITEIIISNWLEYFKKPKPNCPFWRKEYQTNKFYEDLANRYMLELTAVQNLLKVFSPAVLGEYFQKSKMIGFQLLKKETKQVILLELYKAQVNLVDTLEAAAKKEIKREEVKFTGIKKPRATNRISALD